MFSVMRGYNKLYLDTPALAKPSSNPALQGVVVADIDALKAAVGQLRASVSNTAQQATLDQYTTGLAHFSQAIGLASNESYQAALPELGAASTEMNQAHAQISSVCANSR